MKFPIPRGKGSRVGNEKNSSCGIAVCTGLVPNPFPEHPSLESPGLPGWFSFCADRCRAIITILIYWKRAVSRMARQRAMGTWERTRNGNILCGALLASCTLMLHARHSRVVASRRTRQGPCSWSQVGMQVRPPQLQDSMVGAGVEEDSLQCKLLDEMLYSRGSLRLPGRKS